MVVAELIVKEIRDSNVPVLIVLIGPRSVPAAIVVLILEVLEVVVSIAILSIDQGN